MTFPLRRSPVPSGGLAPAAPSPPERPARLSPTPWRKRRTGATYAIQDALGRVIFANVARELACRIVTAVNAMEGG